MTDPDELLDLDAASSLIQVHPDTLRRYAREGKVRYTVMPGSGYRKYRRADLAHLIPRVVEPTEGQET